MSIDGSYWLNPIGCEWIGPGCKDSQSRASSNPSGRRRFAATSVGDNFVHRLKRKRRQLAHARQEAKRQPHSTLPQHPASSERSRGGSSHGHRQRRRGDHRRCPRRDLQAQRSRYEYVRRRRCQYIYTARLFCRVPRCIRSVHVSSRRARCPQGCLS